MDIKINCIDDDKEFTVTKEEQEWYKNKGFDLPKRCKDCRLKRKQNNGQQSKQQRSNWQ